MQISEMPVPLTMHRNPKWYPGEPDIGESDIMKACEFRQLQPGEKPYWETM